MATYQVYEVLGPEAVLLEETDDEDFARALHAEAPFDRRVEEWLGAGHRVLVAAATRPDASSQENTQ